MRKPLSVTPREAKRIQRRLRGVDSLIWRLTSETGLRVSDALNMRVGDVRGLNLSVWESKSKKEREVTLSEGLFRDLKRQCSDRSPDHWLFPSIHTYRKPYNRMTYHRRLKAAQRAASPSARTASAHSARKLYAQKIYKKTKSIKDVQNALQHTRIETTAAYLDMDSAALLEKSGKMPVFAGKIKRFFGNLRS